MTKTLLSGTDELRRWWAPWKTSDLSVVDVAEKECTQYTTQTALIERSASFCRVSAEQSRCFCFVATLSATMSQ